MLLLNQSATSVQFTSDLRTTVIPVLVLILLVTATYYRVRGHVFDLARASESRRTNVLWFGVALVISAIVVGLYLTIHGYLQGRHLH